MSRSNLLSRTLPIGNYYDWVYGGSTPNAREYSEVLNGSQDMPINQVNKRVNGKYPPGGDWIAWQRTKQRVNSEPFTTIRPGYGRAYQGSYQLRYASSGDFPSIDSLYGAVAMSDLTSFLEGLGAEGYARARPAKPDFSLANSILELKDIPGMLRQSIRLCINRIVEGNPRLYYDYGRSAFFRKDNKTRISHTAEWYLALNFGWLPILRDITSFMEATKKSDVSLKQLLRDEGRPIVRRRDIQVDHRYNDPLDVVEYSVNPSPGISPIHVTQCYPNEVFAEHRKRSTATKCQFVAKFRYWLPEGPRDFPWTARLRRRMLGSRITPSVAWNLMPWTFLVDYFSTLGKAVANLGPGVEEQLYTEYCYITFREDILYTDKRRFRTYGQNDTLNTGECTYIEASRLRMRISADPFAFRFTGAIPTIKQTAILASLALSR